MWMTHIVRAPDRFVRQNSYLDQFDGNMLYAYKTPRELKEEANIPLGLAKKIIYLRDNDRNTLLHDMEIESLEKITPSEIAFFVLEGLNKDKNPKDVVKIIHEEHVDGFAMMLYDDHKDFAEDFQIRMMTARRTLTSVQERIKQSLPSKSVRVPEDKHGKNHEKDGKKKQSVTGTNEETVPELSFLQKIGFQMVEGSVSSSSDCQLVAIHSAMPFGKGHALA